METRGSAAAASKLSQTSLAKAKDAPAPTVRNAGRKRSASPADSMDLTNDESFPKLSSANPSVAVASVNPVSGSTPFSSSSTGSSSTRSLRSTPDARAPTPPRRNLSPASRPNRFYFNLRVQPSRPLENNPSVQQHIDAYHASLVSVLETLYKIDNTIALWPFDEPVIHEGGLLTNPSALGHSITQLTMYFHELHIRNEFPVTYVAILLGFSMEYKEFMAYVKLMLPEVHAMLYKRALQAPYVTCLGWLLGTHDDLALSPLESLLQEVVVKMTPTPIPPPMLALSYKPIWDGSKKSDRKKDTSHSGRQGIWAAHVDVETAHAATLRSLLKRVLTSSAITSYTNLPLLLVPLLTARTLQREAEDIHAARAKQASIHASIAKHYSSKIRALDRVLASLDNATLRTTLMAVKSFDGKHLFLSIDPSWNGTGYTVVYPAKYSDSAYEFVEYLPKYLQHAHGDAVFRWFTPEAVLKLIICLGMMLLNVRCPRKD